MASAFLLARRYGAVFGLATAKILFDRGIWGEVHQEKDKRGFFSNVTPVILASGLVGNNTQLFRVGGTNQRPFSDHQNLQNGRTAA